MNIYKITVAEMESLATETWLFVARSLEAAVQLAEFKRMEEFDKGETTWEIIKAESLGTLQNAMRERGKAA